MNLGRHLLLMLVVAVAATVSEGSLLVRRSLLHPEAEESCFTSRREDRPFAYPLIAHFVKIKDMAVRAFKTIVATMKEQRVN